MRLKTNKGSLIQRSKLGVGKQIGQQIYAHKLYMNQIIPQDILKKALEQMPSFKFNTIVWNKKEKTIRFDSAENFNTAREPTAGEYIKVNYKTNSIKKGVTNSIWHHKWMWVKDDYKGFDVQESFEWSKKWLGKLNTTAKGSSRCWELQLKEVGLK